MKRWVLKINDVEYVCVIKAANLVTGSVLMLECMGREFMAGFFCREGYLSSRDGDWNKVSIWNKTKSQIKTGEAIFKEI